MKFYPILFFSLVANIALAQPKQNSPYSRFGIGDPVAQYFFAQTGMGGLTTAWHDPHHLNILNPASYAYLKTTAFETGLNAKRSQYTSSTDKTSSWSGNMSYLALGMTLKSPINEVLDRDQSNWHYGMAFSISPYSTVGYKIQTTTTTENLGQIENNFEGNGGTYRLNYGFGAKYKHTAMGANVGWLFGKSSYENYTVFADTFPTFLNNIKQNVGVRGFIWNVGLQHDFILKTDVNNKDIATEWITVGLTGESTHKLKTTSEEYIIRSRSRSSSGALSGSDTISYKPAESFTLTMPSAFGVGVMYVKNNKFRLGLQYSRENWSSYNNNARPERLRNTNAISLGTEYIPDANAYNNYSKRLRYRMGVYYRQDARLINSKGVDDIGVSVGLGVPVILPRQGTSYVNAAIELGQLGGNTVIKENYLRFSLGFTLNDNSWFYKRRFE